MEKVQLKNMANRIKERRKSLGYTQEKSAEIVGISPSSYTRIENAFQKPALDTLIKIAQHLDLSLDYIIFGTEEHKPKTVSDIDILNSLLDYADDEKLMHASEILIKIAKLKNK